MTDQSIYFIESQRRIVNLIDNTDYQAIINASTSCLDLFTRAEHYLNTALELELTLEKSSKEYSKSSVEVRKVAAKEFSITASVMSSYGTKINKPELTGLKKYTFWKLKKAKAITQVADCNFILGIIAENAAGLVDYKIDAAYTANLQTLVAQLEQLTKLPQEIIRQRANNNILYKEHEKQTKKFYEMEMTPLMEIYQLTDMDFYLAYTASRKMRHHHLKRKPKIADKETATGTLELLALYKTTMEPAAGVSFVAAKLNISEICDEEGETYNDELAPGTYQGRLTFDGYKAIDFDFTIEAGKTTSLQFLMEAEEN